MCIVWSRAGVRQRTGGWVIQEKATCESTHKRKWLFVWMGLWDIPIEVTGTAFLFKWKMNMLLVLEEVKLMKSLINTKQNISMKNDICLPVLVSFITLMTFFIPWNTKGDVMKVKRELYSTGSVKFSVCLRKSTLWNIHRKSDSEIQKKNVTDVFFFLSLKF